MVKPGPAGGTRILQFIGLSVAALAFVGGTFAIVAARAYESESAMIWSARVGDLESLKQQLDRGTPVDSTQKGMSALQWAVFTGHSDAVALLLSHHASPSPALYQALLARRPDMASTLVAAGADPDWRSPSSTMSPREIAASRSMSRFLVIFRRAGARP